MYVDDRLIDFVAVDRVINGKMKFGSLTTAEKRQMVEMLHAQGLSLNAIAERTHSTTTAIKQYVRWIDTGTWEPRSDSTAYHK